MSVNSCERYREDGLNDKSASVSLSDKSEGGSQVQSIPRRCMSVKSRDRYREDCLYDKSASVPLSDKSDDRSQIQLHVG